MSELMTPIPFRDLMNWITTEYRAEGSVFGVHRPYRAGVKKLPIFGGETTIGENAVVGGNAFLTESVESDTKVSIKKPEMTFRVKGGRF